MHSPADSTTASAQTRAVSPLPSVAAFAALGALLHGVGLIGIAVLLWWFLVPATPLRETVTVSTTGTSDMSVAALLQAAGDSIDVVLRGAPDARTRATLRAVRNSGRTVQLSADRALPSLAVSTEERWRSTGGVRIQMVGSDSLLVVSDRAGVIDSIATAPRGTQRLSGPVQGPLSAHADRAVASVEPIAAGEPSSARVLVVGNATWESRFLVAALEEAGWPVDAAVTLSPRVTISQGVARVPSRARHAIVVLLPGASSTVVSALPAFVREGGGLVLVGEAARLAGLGTLRAGVPGPTLAGELGAEASDEPRHGLDLVPIASISSDAVVLETRDGRTAVGARRVGAGRVLQVGYDNSWLWRMAGDDDAPAAHRRWWSGQLAGLVPMRAPITGYGVAAIHDTLDAAPIAAMVRDLGAPVIQPQRVTAVRRNLHASLDPRWILATTLLALVASWIIRRWRGFA